MVEVTRALATPHSPLYAVFVNFTSAFDLETREKSMLILAETGVRMNGLNFFIVALQEDGNNYR